MGKRSSTPAKDQRADRKGRVDGVLGDLRQGKLRRACVGLRLHGVDENRDVKIHHGLPESIEVELAEVCAFDVGGDDSADRAELLDGVVQFGGGILGMRKRLLRYGSPLRISAQSRNRHLCTRHAA